MATEILMPQMGESIAEGTITRWLVKVGDKVERDQPILEISTDKVDAEIPSPASGVIAEIQAQDGETVPVNKRIGLIRAEGEAAADAPAAGPIGVGDVAAPVAAGEVMGHTETVAADTPAANTPADDTPADDTPADDTPADDTGAAEDDEPAEGELSLEGRVRRFSSPLVRSIAAREKVDLRRIQGTGIHGRVTKTDILAYLDARERGEVEAAKPAAAPATQAPAALAAAPAVQPAQVPQVAKPAAPAPAASAPAAVPAGFHVPAYLPGENVVIEPMSRIRQITAQHMAYSKSTSAHVTTVFHMDMTRVAKMRAKVKDRFAKEVGTKLSYMPFIFRAVCNGLKKYPQINASIDGTNIVYKKDVNLGIAVAMPNGLIVPVIKQADEKSLVGLARAANDLADRARTKKLKPEDVQGGTFTVTNPGVFGSLFGTPVINQPQVAILGIGTVEKRAVVVQDADGADAIAIRTMCYMAITFDHRLIDGADADHFMNVIKATLETDDWGELAPYA
jgi:pyruvate dehydrogenase E2 component (dihydrolipoamide acetyltransferase)